MMSMQYALTIGICKFSQQIWSPCIANFGRKSMPVISRHIIVWHIHLCNNIFQLMVGHMIKHLYSIYDEYKEHNIRLITEDGTIATVQESMCRFLTMTGGYRPKEQWSLEMAYNYFVRCLQDLLIK
uniref:Uncharacterized protein n=1 Tax=Romanomermis culicivorax TaxID=13658 RepID=A0A915LD17_ROMCU